MTTSKSIRVCGCCDGRGWTPTHWHGHHVPAERDKPEEVIGGIWRVQCERCYGLGRHPQNVTLFHQMVGKALLARFTQTRSIFEAAWWLTWWWNGVLLTHVTPKLLRWVAIARTPATRCYPPGLIKRTARVIVRGLEAETIS